MEDRENMENMEDRESRDVIGRKKGPVLASIILAVVLIVFTRGKGLFFSKGAGTQEAENGQVQENGEENAVTLKDVLSDPDAFGEALPETVEVLVDGGNVSVNGWICRDGEELRSFLTAFAAPDRGYEILSGGAEPGALQWVRETFDSLDIPYAEASDR